MAILSVPTIHVEDTTVERRRYRLRDTLIGLLFVGPATVLTLIFGLYPVVYGFFVSLQDGGIAPFGFVGLRNYVKALGAVAYLFALAVALVCLLGGHWLWRRSHAASQAGQGNFIPYFAPSFIAAPATLFLGALVFLGRLDLALFPIAAIAVAVALYAVVGARTPGTPLTAFAWRAWAIVLLVLSGVILGLFTFQQIDVNTTGTFAVLGPLFDDIGIVLPPLEPQFLAVALLTGAVVLTLLFSQLLRAAREAGHDRLTFLLGLIRVVTVLVSLAALVILVARADQLRVAAMSIGQLDQDKLTAALATLPGSVLPDQAVNDLLTWPAVFAVLLGTALLGSAYFTWQNAMRRESTPGLLGVTWLAIALLSGGWLLIGELPNAVASGDPDFYASLLRTGTYTLGTVPIEMGFGLGLAYLLFHVITVGRGLYRMIYFIPYIAPTVATAAVFIVIFSLNNYSPANQFMHLLGLPSQQWLRTTKGIFQIMAQIIGGPGVQLPSFLVGPSLPLTVAVLFGIWVFTGYNAVIFMAGLGAVPRELYEAAEVDGAGRWASFRYMTLPLISPTTFFLTILSVIGTLQALTHLYVLRQDASRGAMDTATVYLYIAIQRYGQLPYASTMAFVLFAIILVFTLIQNRVARNQVFYG